MMKLVIGLVLSLCLISVGEAGSRGYARSSSSTLAPGASTPDNTLPLESGSANRELGLEKNKRIATR